VYAPNLLRHIHFDFTKEDAELGLKYAERVFGQAKQAFKINREESQDE